MASVSMLPCARQREHSAYRRQDGQQAGLDGLALFFLCFDALGKAAVACQQCSADQAEEPLHPVFDDPVQHAYTSTMGMP